MPSRVSSSPGRERPLSLARGQGRAGASIPSLRHPARERGDDVALADALASSGARGSDRTGLVPRGRGRRRSRCRPIPFERRRFWIIRRRTPAGGDAVAFEETRDPPSGFYVPGWKRCRRRGDGVERARRGSLRRRLEPRKGGRRSRLGAGARVATLRAGRSYARGRGPLRDRSTPPDSLRTSCSGPFAPHRPSRARRALGAPTARARPAAPRGTSASTPSSSRQAWARSAAPTASASPSSPGTLRRDRPRRSPAPERAALVGICRVGSQEYQDATLDSWTSPSR